MYSLETCPFAHRLFEVVPGAKALFSRVHVDDMRSPEFSAQMVRVMTGLDIAINALNDQSLLKSLTGHLSSQHAARPGVTAAGLAVNCFFVGTTALSLRGRLSTIIML